MPAYHGRIAIVGVAESDYGRVPNMTELQLHAQAIQRALEDGGLHKDDIDGVFCSSDTMSMPMFLIVKGTLHPSQKVPEKSSCFGRK